MKNLLNLLVVLITANALNAQTHYINGKLGVSLPAGAYHKNSLDYEESGFAKPALLVEANYINFLSEETGIGAQLLYTVNNAAFEEADGIIGLGSRKFESTNYKLFSLASSLAIRVGYEFEPQLILEPTLGLLIATSPDITTYLNASGVSSISKLSSTTTLGIMYGIKANASIPFSEKAGLMFGGTYYLSTPTWNMPFEASASNGNYLWGNQLVKQKIRFIGISGGIVFYIDY